MTLSHDRRHATNRARAKMPHADSPRPPTSTSTGPSGYLLAWTQPLPLPHYAHDPPTHAPRLLLDVRWRRSAQPAGRRRLGCKCRRNCRVLLPPFPTCKISPPTGWPHNPFAPPQGKSRSTTWLRLKVMPSSPTSTLLKSAWATRRHVRAGGAWQTPHMAHAEAIKEKADGTECCYSMCRTRTADPKFLQGLDMPRVEELQKELTGTRLHVFHEQADPLHPHPCHTS